jgi:hypothetical protein
VAIQAAVNWGSRHNAGGIYFPMGAYRITSPIIFGRDEKVGIAFLGEPGTEIVGNFNGFLLKGRQIDKRSGRHSVENLRLHNRHLRGGGIAFRDCLGGQVRNCSVSAWRGIEGFEMRSPLLVDTCSIIAPEQDASSVGIMAGSATTVISTHVSGYGHGIRHHNEGLVVYGGHFEVNRSGIVLGLDENRKVFNSSGFDISGLSMEANQTGIDVEHGTGGRISGLSIGGDIPMEYGLRLGYCRDVAVQSVTVDSTERYRGAGISIERAHRVVLVGVSSVASERWLLPKNQSRLSLIQTNNP